MSLWLRKGPRLRGIAGTEQEVVRLSRFADYPYFFEAFENLDVRRPVTAQVLWRPFSDFVKYAIAADNEEHAEQIGNFLDDVADRMKAGEDIPPLVRDAKTGSPLDGTHRAFAARSLGIRKAPTIYV